MNTRREVECRSANDVERCLTGPRFDYRSVPSSQANFLKGQADRIRHQYLTSIIQIGNALLEAKRHLSHGALLSWIQCEVRMPVRTAQAYMRVAQWASGQKPAVARLPPSVLYLLSAASTPGEFVADIIARAEAGELISPSVIRNELKLLQMNGCRNGSIVQSNMTGRLQESGTPRKVSGGLNEFVEILRRRLSAADLKRVREIVDSEAALFGQELSKSLGGLF
jgi:hypothetical protein